ICLGERVTCSWNLINTATRLQSGCWSSTPPVRHNNGATFSFADGHTEYHKWLGRALEVAKKGCVSYSTCPASQCSAFPCDKDLFYMAKGVCGSVGPNPSSVSGSNPAFVPPPGCDIE
ncbi:MAG: hypothetical protein JW947_08795, partial [Sedimentisphaerales bacterium]|nr:hypothetical protein [Sedimentisphaerales bacterium]